METLRLATGDYGVNKQLKTRSRISDRVTLEFKKIDAILEDVRALVRTADFDQADYEVCEMVSPSPRISRARPSG